MCPADMKTVPVGTIYRIAAVIYIATMVSVCVDVGSAKRKGNTVMRSRSAAKNSPATIISVSVALLKMMHVKFPQTAVVILLAKKASVSTVLH